MREMCQNLRHGIRFTRMRRTEKMFDINEIRKRAQEASERAADAAKKTFEKARN